VCGVVNDLTASGARAQFLTVGLFMSASLGLKTLERVLRSLGAEAAKTGCMVLCGDTKVHERSEPQLLISMTALGRPFSADCYSLSASRPDDLIGLTGPVGNHSIAVLSAREGLGFDSVVTSDAASLVGPFETAAQHVQFRSLRDLTRGGLLAAMWEGAHATGLNWQFNEALVPIDRPVAAATELLGLDPFLLTNEGTMLFTVERNLASDAVCLLRKFPETAATTIIGEVLPPDTMQAQVTMISKDAILKSAPYPHALGIPRLC
jgi:hydrogenase expression/formation protein HypE